MRDRHVVIARLAVTFVAWITCVRPSPAASAASVSKAVIDVFAASRQQRVWPEIIGINLNPGAGAAAIQNPEVIEAVRKIGIRSVRFPNGCVADRYNFKAADGKKQISVEQFLTFCEAIGAEPYYTLNLQGGTENKEGPPPDGADLDETVRYRHLAPNPCGWTDYHFGTLAEAVELVQEYTVERALEGRRPILCYEMGNENWGQATTDWWPELYAATIAEFARAIREVVRKARKQNDTLEELRLHITAVGYPMMGNNQDPTQATNREINVRWTREVNALHQAGLIDAVQDHFYPYNGTASDLLVWSHHNLQNILRARRGVANPGLGGYLDEALGYRMPIEITEWNLKCWGERRKTDLKAANLEFEEGFTGWDVQLDEAGKSVWAIREAGRHGAGLRLASPKKTEKPLTLYQAFDWKDKKAKKVFASAWVRTDSPENLALWLVAVNEDGSLGKPLEDSGERHAQRAGHWHKIVVGGKVPDGASRLAVGFSLVGPDAQADVDAVELFYWNAEHKLAPTGVDTPAQQLFLVDAFRVMIEHGIRRSHLHHLFGSYACGTMYRDGRTKDNYKVLEFLAGRLGTHTVRTAVKCETFDHDCLADRYATDFNAIAPDVKGVPVVSALAMRDDRRLYVLAINRTTDVRVEATIRVHGARIVGTGFARRLTCKDFDVPGVRVGEYRRPVGESVKHGLAPHSAYLLKLKLME